MSPASPTATRPDTLIVDGFGSIADRYDLVLCDVWGVLHDGVKAFAAAGEALGQFRKGGGHVVLVSNAPRPGSVVEGHLASLGVAREAYDAIRTSGDMTREIVAAHGDRAFHHVGPARDLGLFDGLPARPAPISEADYVVCTGLLDDETETIEDYAGALAEMRERDLEMICANPDLVVERGHRLILCAGALAARYEELGGRTLTPGKPHKPIYEASLKLGAELAGRGVPQERVLAVGDAIRTDVAGGSQVGIDTLLVARGIHAVELGIPAGGSLDPEHVAGWIDRQAFAPTFVTRELAW